MLLIHVTLPLTMHKGLIYTLKETPVVLMIHRVFLVMPLAYFSIQSYK